MLKKKKEELKNEKEKPMKNEEELTFLQSIHGGSHLSLLYTAWKRRQYEMDMNKHVPLPHFLFIQIMWPHPHHSALSRWRERDTTHTG